MNRNKRNKRNKKNFLIYTFQIKLHQVYSNTRVTTEVNTSQHESTRVNTSLTRVNTSQHESDTNQLESKHESDTSLARVSTNQNESNTCQQESDTSQDESTQVKTCFRILRSKWMKAVVK